MPRPRIDDVARRAGVSKTAVSFAFNQPEHLRDETRERILRAAEELGYRPSPIARRLASRRTDQIGLVVPQSTHEVFANPFLPELLRGMGDACDAEGLSIVIVPPVRGSIAHAVQGALVDGLILLGLVPHHPDLELVRRAGLPVVALDVEVFEGADVIAIDDVGGARQAAEHLAQLGHRDIAVILIAQHPDSPINEEEGISARRLAGIRDGFRRAGGDPVSLRLVSTTVSEEGGRAAWEALQADGAPSAVITMSDVTAIGLIAAAVDAGVRVPDDLSVVGFDDIPAASWTAPRLTTVHQPIRDKGRRAAQRVIDVIRNADGREPVTETLPARLVVRGSTAPARTSRLMAPVAGAVEGGGDTR
jgi:alanine racemase